LGTILIAAHTALYVMLLKAVVARHYRTPKIMLYHREYWLILCSIIQTDNTLHSIARLILTIV